MAKFSQWISQLRVKLGTFRRNYLIFPKYALLISVLISSHILAEKTVILIIYITDTRTRLKIDLRGATLIVSVQEGVTGVMSLLLGHISIAYSGPFKILLSSTLAYIVGVVLLWRDLSFYVAVFLIVVGTAGVQPLLQEFLATQLKNSVEDEEIVESRTKFWWSFWYFFGSFGAAFGMANISTWERIFQVIAIFMGVGLVIFFSGFKFYQDQLPTTSPLTNIYRVFKAAISKRHLPYPDDTEDAQLCSHSQCLRFLDKATIPQEQEGNEQLCTVGEVNELKLLLRTVLVSATFPVYCLISIVGGTFFFLQVDNLNRRFTNDFRVTPAFFILVESISRRSISFLYWLVTKRWPNVEHTRMVLGVLCAFLCCITAWYVEDQILKDNDSMHVFWLTPQFCLLGFMEGLVGDVLTNFFYNHLGNYIMRYEPFLSDFVFGISTFPNMFWILTGWIGPTIEESRVDKCYLVLAILVIPNAIFYWYVSTYVIKRVESGDAQENNLELRIENAPIEQEENLESGDDNVSRGQERIF